MADSLKLECTCRKKECRRGRPLCRARRKTSRRYRHLCDCGLYGFPHRPNSGRCGNPEQAWALVYGRTA